MEKNICPCEHVRGKVEKIKQGVAVLLYCVEGLGKEVEDSNQENPKSRHD